MVTAFQMARVALLLPVSVPPLSVRLPVPSELLVIFPTEPVLAVPNDKVPALRVVPPL